MQTAIVLENTKVLKQNNEHKNFTETKETIPVGTTITGKTLIVEGLRRGEPFRYRLFVLKDGRIIYQNKIKPMAVTEVTLGADAGQTPTIVNTATPKNNFTTYTIGGALIGGGLAWYFSKKLRNMSNQRVMLFTGIGAVAGFMIGKRMEKSGIKIIKSK